MKKLICILLALLTVLFCAACDNGQTGTEQGSTEQGSTEQGSTEQGGNEQTGEVTIFVLDTVEIYDTNGNLLISGKAIWEDGWENKESFTLHYDFGNEEMNQQMGEMVYGDKGVTQTVHGQMTSTSYYDENGCVTLMVQIYEPGASQWDRFEFARTYDVQGRRLSETQRYWLPGDTEMSGEETAQYVITDTATGSEAVFTNGSAQEVRIYDENYRQVIFMIRMNGEEVTRTETTYDEYGNVIREVSYSEGQKISETRYTYKEVEVSAEAAQRMTYFKRKN